MIRVDEAGDPRRRLLIQALAAGLFAAVLPGGRTLAAEVFGTGSLKLPAGRSIFRLSGNVLVNGNAATIETRIFAGDTVETSKDSEIVFVVGGNAMILRGESRIELQTGQKDSTLLDGLRMRSGKLLSVSRDRTMQIETTTAFLGIRGTGFYLESEPQRTYFCTCYGSSEIAAIDDRESRQTVVSTRHDKPLYILAGAKPGRSIRRAPVINHTDQELALIEALVGRKPPFAFPGRNYNAP